MLHVEFTRIIKRPLKETFAWCTDFEPQDVRFWGAEYFRIISKNGSNLVFECGASGGSKLVARVKLMPPNRWEADYEGDDFTEHIVYTLEQVENGTKLTYVGDVTYAGKYANMTKEEAQKGREAFWDSIIPVLEKEVKT